MLQATAPEGFAQEREAFSGPGRPVLNDAGVEGEVCVKEFCGGSARNKGCAKGFGG